MAAWDSDFSLALTDYFISKVASVLPVNTSLSPPESATSPSSSSDGNASSASNRASDIQVDHRKRGASQTDDARLDGALKDRRASSDSVSGETFHHTHPDRAGSDEGDEQGENGKGRTTEKRKLQNRRAQQNFRQRKEQHLKELEDRVLSLESSNSNLTDLVQRLQKENEQLKDGAQEAPFDFSFALDVNNSSSMPLSTQFAVQKPTTQFDANFPFDAFIGSTSMFAPPSHAPFPPVTQSSSLAMHSAFVTPSVPAPMAALTPPSSGPPMSASSDSQTFSDLFNSFRDNAAEDSAYPDLDTFYAGGQGQSDDLSAFFAPSPPAPANIASPIASGSDSAAKVASPAVPLCPYGTSTATFNFDVDGLCSELKMKAVCHEAARSALEQAMKEDERAIASLKTQ